MGTDKVPVVKVDLAKMAKDLEVFGNGRDLEQDYERAVWRRHQSRCANCGFEERLRVRLVVPPEAGGKEVATNAVLLCRACEMALDSSTKSKSEDTRVVCFMLSRGLHESVTQAIASRNGYRSFTGLVRGLVERYVTDPDRFDDLGNFQDDRSTDDRVKVNVWIGRSTYALFKAAAALQNCTVTGTLVSLLMLYRTDTVPLLAKKEL